MLKIFYICKKYLTGIIEVEDDEGLKYQIEMNFDQVMLREERTFKVNISCEGSFFSTYKQFFSYTLEVNGVSIVQTKL